MRAAHFLIILCFLTMFTVGLHSPWLEAPFNNTPPFFFSSNIPSLNVLRVSSFHALGRQIKCWMHFFISFIYSFVQSAPHCARWVCVVVGGHAHFAWQRTTRDTSEQLFLEWWVLPDGATGGRRSYRCYSVCVCVCVFECVYWVT